jgi:hypothetical protein
MLRAEARFAFTYYSVCCFEQEETHSANAMPVWDNESLAGLFTEITTRAGCRTDAF